MPLDRREPKVAKERLAPLARKVVKEQPGQLGARVHRELRAVRELRAPKAQLARQGRRGVKDLRG